MRKGKILKMATAVVLTATMLFGLVACGGKKEETPANDQQSTEAEATTDDTAGTDSADTASTDAAAPADDKQLTIGFTNKDISDTFQNYIIEAMQNYADANNIKLQVSDAQNDSQKQQNQVDDFVTQGVDAIVVAIIDSSTSGPMVESAKAAGIPIVFVNTDPFTDGIIPEGAYYVGSVEKEAGEMQADYVGEKLGGKGDAVILMGSLGHQGAVDRTEGNKDLLKEKYPDMKVLAEQTAKWMRDEAVTVTENYITTYGKDIKAVFANNDEMALGAIKALEDNGMSDVLVCGIDGTVEGLKAVEEGKMACTIFQDAKGQGEGAMELAVKAAKGENPQQDKWIPFQLITADNVADFK